MTAVEQGTNTGKSSTGVAPLLVSTGVSVAGDGAFIAAAPLFAASLTHSPLAISTVTMATYVPWLFVGLPAGALVDRWPKRRVMVTADLVRALALAGLCALIWTSHASVAALVVTVLIICSAQCFFDPSAQGVIPAVVGQDRARLDHVNGQFWALDAMGRSLIGPFGGSWAFTVGRVFPFLGDCVSFLISALCVSRLPKFAPPPKEHEPVLAAVRTGMRQLFASRELLVLALGMGAYNCGYNIAFATFVLFTRNVLHVGAVAYGALLATMAIGGVLAGWRGTRLVKGRPAREVHAVALTVQGLAWLGIAVFENIWLTAALFVLVGAVSTLTTVAVASARQTLAPEGSLGRIVAAFRVFGLGLAGLGAIVGGAIAGSFGLTASLVVATFVQLSAAVLVWAFRR
jgi:MFS family permease